jgi:hypothetical protein
LSSKIKAVIYKGNKCNICGYENNSKNFASFEFHHPDKNKEYAIGAILNRKWNFIQKELDKCILLCSNCHRQMHSGYDKELFEFSIKKINEEKIQKEKVYNFCSCGNKISSHSKICLICRRKVARPSKEELLMMIKTIPITKIGEKYNVSDNAVRKWLKSYNLPYKLTDIKKLKTKESIAQVV